ncbi:cytochrome b562 [Actomonas aquatica]|uniref:Cytochrome b562 n=1 Tax=Actomonas aquatica TaxID=2866162 RepID=A0ABZ1C4D7_9BACT|nr:cytochrome b562 [Opitutus sp. WL0086]WRQ86240.1 cytochrome b562 [Opitutus sp. WL0086]
MKLRRLLLLSSLAALLTLPTAARADEEEHTPLGEQMEVMGDAFRDLRRSVREADRNAESLELLATIREAAVKSLDYEPEYAADIPEAQRADFIKKYHEDMKVFLTVIDDVASALKAGDNAKAEALVGEMRSAQRSGHKAYRRPKD